MIECFKKTKSYIQTLEIAHTFFSFLCNAKQKQKTMMCLCTFYLWNFVDCSTTVPQETTISNIRVFFSSFLFSFRELKLSRTKKRLPWTNVIIRKFNVFLDKCFFKNLNGPHRKPCSSTKCYDCNPLNFTHTFRFGGL